MTVAACWSCHHRLLLRLVAVETAGDIVDVVALVPVVDRVAQMSEVLLEVETA